MIQINSIKQQAHIFGEVKLVAEDSNGILFEVLRYSINGIFLNDIKNKGFEFIDVKPFNNGILISLYYNLKSEDKNEN